MLPSGSLLHQRPPLPPCDLLPTAVRRHVDKKDFA
jgi:hypothetical protein